MMLNCLFLVHRHKVLAVRYVSPTDDNRYQAQKMKTDSLFADVRDEVGHIVVSYVNAEGVKALLVPDRNRLNALIRRAYPSERAAHADAQPEARDKPGASATFGCRPRSAPQPAPRQQRARRPSARAAHGQPRADGGPKEQAKAAP